MNSTITSASPSALHRSDGIKIRLLLWFSFLAMGAGVPFLNLYYKHVLVTPSGEPSLGIIGVLLFVQSILGIFSSPLIGIIADKYKIGARLLFLCALLASAGAFLIALPGFPMSSAMPLATKSIVIGTGIIILGIFLPSIIPMINTETLNLLHRSGRDPREYGSYRLLGSISWIVSTTVIGFILYTTGNLKIAPFIYTILLFALMLISLVGVRAHVTPVKIPWAHIAKNRQYWLFIVFTFLQGVGLNSVLSFTAYFMDDAHINYFVIGSSFAVAAVLEIPVMIFSKRIIARVGSPLMVIIGTGFLAVKTFLLYLLVPLGNPLFVFLASSTHGLGYGLQFNGMIDMIDRLGHRDLRATYMNVFNALGFSVSSAVGGVLSAFIIKISSSTQMMFVNGCIAIASIAYFGIVFMKKNAVPEPVR